MSEVFVVNSIEYKVDIFEVGSDSKTIEVTGTVEFEDINESCIDFTFEYNKTQLDYFVVNNLDLIDIEEFDMSKKEFIDFIYDLLPIEDIESEVEKNYEELKKEEREYIEDLRLNDMNEYMCQMKNNFGGFLYE